LNFFSLGFYLAAGEVLTVISKTSFQNWAVRIGCHSDLLNDKDPLKRYPSITKSIDIISTTTKVTSPFGGLIYLVSTSNQTSSISVTLSNVVRASFYDIDNPSGSWWSTNPPAPWAEIQGKYLTMALPAAAIKNLEDPKSVAQYYDEVIQEFHRVRSTTPLRRERIVPDIEISVGYMHAGYPIMTYLDVVTVDSKHPVVPMQLNVPFLKQKGSWGHFHEIGHNLQKAWWTFDGTVEVTNNIFSLLGGWICCKIPVLENEWMKGRYEALATLINNGYLYRSKDEAYNFYKSDASSFIVLYALLINQFGWETFRKTFAAYESPTGPRPTVNQDKIDTWVIELSKASGRNLLPFFDIWRMPVSAACVQTVNALRLPVHVPQNTDFPYSKFNPDYLNQIRTNYKYYSNSISVANAFGRRK
jgi:hypothetical protein